MSDRNSDASFIVGFTIGATVGLAIGFLYAPKPGRETRTLLKERAVEAKETATKVEKRVEEKLRRRKAAE
ncbi:MAG: YtxH domain-containing protein [Dehalococcoidales bacterium]|nr:YtxH domain-containing protein [Dehalococcoidales bacterium]